MPIRYLKEFAHECPPGMLSRDLLMEVLTAFEVRSGQGSLLIARKGKDLPEVIEAILDQGRFPVVDKKTGHVFGVPPGNHERFRGLLYTHTDPEDARSRTEIVSAARYLGRGCGYYISSMPPRMVLCATRYLEDGYDKPLFATYRVHRMEVNI